MVAPTIDMQFLHRVIAIERMIFPDGDTSTIERFSDCLALCLAVNTSERITIRDEAKKLYNKRSRIVHAAYSNVSEKEAIIMEEWALKVITYALKRIDQFDSHEKFCKNLSDMKFGNS